MIVRQNRRPQIETQLPAWLLPFPHAGRCYDQIGALSIGVGAAGSALAAVAVTAASAVIAGQDLSLATAMPDVSTTGLMIVAGSLLAGGWRLGRHWLAHRSTARGVQVIADEVSDLIAAVGAGDAELGELVELLDQWGLSLHDLGLELVECRPEPAGEQRPAPELVAAAGRGV